MIKCIDSNVWVGGMIGCALFYSPTCKSEDIIVADFESKMHNYLPFDIMTSGKLPDYFLDFIGQRYAHIDYKEREQKVILGSLQKLDHLAFLYYRSGVQSSLDHIEDFIDLEDAILFDYRNLKNPDYTANEWGWQVDAEGLRYSLIDLYHRHYKLLFIVESGIGIDEKLGNGKVYDDERIEYYRKHITSLKCAVEHDGVDLMGYPAWSPVDFLSNYKEMRKRYGFVYVNRGLEDLLDLARYKKKSLYWYKKVTTIDGENLQNNIEY